tara:strand:+ start:3164 stop:3313 length:150 start_codon:yes stop_codon:yes gene_type:complete
MNCKETCSNKEINTKPLTVVAEFLTISAFFLIMIYSPWIIQNLAKLTGE